MPFPNVILIVADQMRVHEMGCYGGATPPHKPNTPNIDALAETGIRFDKAFTPNPVCTPARSSIITGQYGRSCIGTVGNAADPTNDRIVFPNKTIAELLKDEGYETALTGKWHMHVSPERLGFDDCVYPKFNHLNKNQDYNINGEKRVVEGNAYEFELETTRKFIQKKHGRPFFLYHNISMPHMPYFDMDDEFKYRYKSGEMPLRPNVEPGKPGMFDDLRWFRIYMYDYLYYNHHGEQYTVLPENFNIEDLYAMYRGMVYAADYQVGKIVEFVEAAGLRDDTIIVFVSDHGDNMGSHGYYNKDCSYEESIRVPFIISAPGQTKKTAVACGDVASLIDVAPTILDMCKMKIPDHIQGISLAPLFAGNETAGRDRAFIECSNGELVCRTAKYKLSVLVEYCRDKGGWSRIADKNYRFSDLENDPYEIIDDIDDSINNKIKEELYDSIMTWDSQTKWVKRP